MKYNKLIRDKIPDIIKRSGGNPIIHIANGSEYLEKLNEKLKEEVSEFINENNEEELVDILEVINVIYEFNKFNKKKLEILRKEKSDERGKFNKRIILEKT